VSPNPPIEVVCEISSLEEPISGRVRDTAGQAVEFRGWMDFASALLTVAGATSHVNEAGPAAAPRQEG